jgi:hypothetical protein
MVSLFMKKGGTETVNHLNLTTAVPPDTPYESSVEGWYSALFKPGASIHLHEEKESGTIPL